MPNPFTESSRDERWEVGLPELNMEQLRAPASLRWLKQDAKPAATTLGTFALESMFQGALIKAIIGGQYRAVIRQIVRTWPELLTDVSREIAAERALTVVSEPDDRQKRPLAKASAR